MSIQNKRLQWLAEKRRRMLWIGVLATLIPLGLMLVLQGWWLKRLHSVNQIASQVTSDQFVEKVANGSGNLLRYVAWDFLHMNPDLVVGRWDTLNYVFYHRLPERMNEKMSKDKFAVEVPVPKAPVGDPLVSEAENRGKSSSIKEWPWLMECFFVAPFEGERAGEIFYYDTKLRIGGPKPTHPEIVASVRKATSDWEQIHANRMKVGSIRITSYNTQDDYPVLLYPILRDSGELVGVVGMVISADYWLNKVLPNDISMYSDMIKGRDWMLRVYNARQETVMELSSTMMCEDEALQNSRRKLSGFMEGYKIELFLRPSSIQDTLSDWVYLSTIVPFSQKFFSAYMPPEKYLRNHSGNVQMINMAGTNLFINVLLALLLSGFILAGVILALRTAVKELELSEMKSDFVSNVSHELRTPLASIRVFGELLRLGRVPNQEKVMEYGAYIEHEGRRLSRLINNILDFSKIESGQKLYHFQERDVALLVRDAVETFRVRLSNTKQRMVFEEPEGRLPLIHVDSDAFNQVLFNVIDNGIKYGKEDGTVTVSLGRVENFIQISVRDDGIGIAKEELDKIFERFHRVSTGLVHDVKGSGLGLSIVKHVVSAHRGEVRVRSNLGKGSTFSILLPIENGPALGEQSVPVEDFA